VVRRRKHDPIFDAIIELRVGATDEWIIYRNVAGVVDAILAKEPYSYERRYRDEAGQLYIAKGEKEYRGDLWDL